MYKSLHFESLPMESALINCLQLRAQSNFKKSGATWDCNSVPLQVTLTHLWTLFCWKASLFLILTYNVAGLSTDWSKGYVTTAVELSVVITLNYHVSWCTTACASRSQWLMIRNRYLIYIFCLVRNLLTAPDISLDTFRLKTFRGFIFGTQLYFFSDDTIAI
jgi:hypothetical protein